MDILTLTERIKTSIALGESHFREFKSAWEIDGSTKDSKPRDPKSLAKDISEALVGFANADGGELIIGVEDNGNITGISYKEETIKKLLESYKSTVFQEKPLEGVFAQKIILDNHTLLYFMVDKGTRYVYQTSDGRCLQRRDRETIPVTFEKLQFERQEQISREYDRSFVDGATILDLNSELLRTTLDMITKGISVEKSLQFLGLSEYSLGNIRLRRAALLLFANDVTRWHPRCEVRIIRFRGTEQKTGREYNALPEEVATGNILQLLTTAWDKLRPHLVQTKLTNDALFRSQVMYPEDACKEALINAIAHRDYSIEGRSIEIYIFDDRMEVKSPGALLSTIKVDDLKKLQGVHQSRNAMIARVLREVGYMREMGEGLRRIYKLMRDYDLIDPELKADQNEFSIILRHKSVFSDLDQRWLNEYQILNLTRDEMLIALLGKNGDHISPQQIWDTLDLVDTGMYQSIVDQMMTKGILFRTYNRSVANQEARLKGIKIKQFPQFGIRQPDDCRKALTELFKVIGETGPTEDINKLYIDCVTSMLPQKNPYNYDFSRYIRLFKCVGLLNEMNEPTNLLHEIWNQAQQNDSLDNIKQDRNRCEAPSNNNTNFSVVVLFVGNIDFYSKKQELESLFNTYGRVLKISMPLDASGEYNRGYAFVTMRDSPNIQKAIEELNGMYFNGKHLRVELSKNQ
jgi:ATP-dependent DNA helicase RecG